MVLGIPAPAGQGNSAAPARLLIVDDEVPQMRALCETLELKGYSTRGFSSPRQALLAVHAGEFDLLITDLVMPEMDGITLLKSCRQIDKTLDAIMMTGHGTIDSAVRAMQLGACDYVLKPFTPSSILPVIARVLDARRLREENRSLRERLQAEDRASAVMEHAAIGMALAEPSGRWLKVNTAMCEMLGFTESELLQWNVAGITHPEDVDTDAHHRRRLLAGDTHKYQVEKRFRHRDGHFISALLSVSLVSEADRSVAYLVSQIQDVSAGKEMDRIKREFISTMSHELRTPLTSMRGSLELVASGMAGTLPATAARLVKIACRNTDRLTRIVNDILDLQLIESGTMVLEPARHALGPLVERAVQECLDYAQNCRVRLAIPLPLPAVAVRVDAGRIVQILGNLISNAVKFSPADSMVEIGMTVDDGAVRVTVTDHGPGIMASFRQRIFGRFSQADSSDRRHKEGAGLGLTIAKALVESMGGTIGYKTDAGVATTFFFQLPLDGD